MSIKKRSSFPSATHVHDQTREEDVTGGRHPMLQGQHLTVYQFIQENPYCTREDVSRATAIRSSTVTARIKELIDEGFVMEPPGMRKTNRSGVSAKCLYVTDRAQGGKPLDKVRIELQLTVDNHGTYGVRAYVVDGTAQSSNAVPIKTAFVTMTAPHPDTYRSMVDQREVVAVSRHELQAHAEDIIDVDFVVVDK